LAVIDAGLGVVERWQSSKIGESLIYDLRRAVFEHVQQMPVAFFTRTRTGALVSRLNNDVIGAQRAFTSTLSGLVANVIQLVLSVGVMITLSWQVTLIALVLLPIFVLQRSVLAKQLEELASTDQKTGLLNATAWHQHSQRELSRAARTGGEFSVLMIDLDFFKKINDTYGHLAGDDMLIALANLLKRETRTHDLVGRFGGEEFTVLLAGASELDA
ncbi:diguanylate cyclase, partial [Kibdelosporangium lantanae]